MSARWLAVVLVVAGWGCATGLGDRCAENQPCGEPFVCGYPPGDGGVGVCDYPPRGFGEPCTRAAECAADLTCSNHFTPGERYGTCVHRRGEGEVCFEDRDCLSGHCEAAGGDGLDGICAAPQ